MTPDSKRMAQACRVYAALLRYYPISFQQEFGEIQALQFHDEYREVQASEKKFSILRFWLFIVCDFVRSLLREYLDEVIKMLKKNLFIYSAIASGALTLILINSLTGYLINSLDEGWRIQFVFPFIQIFGAFTLLGVVKAKLNTPVFWVLSILVLLIAIWVSLLYLAGGMDSMWLADLLVPILDALFGDEDTGFGISIMGYFYSLVVFGVAVLVSNVFTKRNWLLAVCIIIIPLPMLLNRYIYQFVPGWLSTNISGILPAAAWFTIAWLLKKEHEERPLSEALEAAG